MQDEELDKIVREAASQHHPPYDDNAWDKMEQLLDKHLPLQKDRRRPVFFLLLMLLVCAGLFYTLIYPGIGNDDNKNNGDKNILAQAKPGGAGSNAQLMTTTNEDPARRQTITASSLAPTIVANDNIVTGTKNNDDIINRSNNHLPVTANKKVPAKNINTSQSNDLYTGAAKLIISKKARTNIHIKNSIPETDDILANAKINTTGSATKTGTGEDNTEEDEPTTVKQKEKANNPVGAKNITSKTEVREEDKKTIALVTDKEKERKKTEPDNRIREKENKQKGFPVNFGITASMGTDLSYVNPKEPGKATFIYGAGLSYKVGKRLLVRTGFYVSRKIYTAYPKDYNGTIYPNLNSIDGDCKVYEIPVSVSYNFGAKKKHNWFGSAGVSSFIMKKEYYNYTYKTPSGYLYSHDHTISNANKHTFSVLNLSAGYQYQVSPKVLVMAEPFLKLPLKGIGDGKMKLNSAGVLLTATVRPFVKKNK